MTEPALAAVWPPGRLAEVSTPSASYRARLVEYLEAHRDALDADSQRRLTTNPLRVLDSKNPAMQEIIAGAPRLLTGREIVGGEERQEADQAVVEAGADGLERRVAMPGTAAPHEGGANPERAMQAAFVSRAIINQDYGRKSDMRTRIVRVPE